MQIPLCKKLFPPKNLIANIKQEIYIIRSHSKKKKKNSARRNRKEAGLKDETCDGENEVWGAWEIKAGGIRR